MSAYGRPGQPDMFRQPPADIPVEQALLGALILDSRAFSTIAEGMSFNGEMFFDPLHQRLYQAIETRCLGGENINPLTLYADLKGDPGLAEVGGHGYLAGLAAATPVMPDLLGYAKIIAELARRRALIRIGDELVAEAYDIAQRVRAEALADNVAEQLYRATRDENGSVPFRAVREFSDQALSQMEHAMSKPEQAFLTSGLQALDVGLGPMFRGDLVVLAGATSSGKTSLAQQCSMANALRGDGVGFWSLEMPGSQLAMRHMAQKVRVSASRMRQGKLSSQEFEAAALTPGSFHGLPFFIDESPRLKVSQIRSKAMALKRRLGQLGLVVVDHLQFIEAEDPRMDEKDHLRAATRDLKALAKELDVAVLLLSHITKENERRTTKRPVLADLYGSVGIQQNADEVRFVYREHYYLMRERPDSSKNDKERTMWMKNVAETEGKAEIYLDKNRMGKVGSVTVGFNDSLTEFFDLEPTDPPGADTTGLLV